MSSDDQRISTGDLLAMAEPVHVDSLTAWSGDPWQGDVGQRVLQSTVFGQIGLVLTYGSEVIYGADLVDAQRFQPDDDGMVPVVDLAKAGFTRAKAEAASLALWTNHRNATVDDVMLAELVTSLIQSEQEALSAAGWDGDDLDALIAQIERDEQASLGGDADDVPEVREGPTTTNLGDVWLLGPHKLVCGDSATASNYPDVVALVVTDPPYGVSYADKNAFLNGHDKGNHIQQPIVNDHMTPEETQRLWVEVFTLCHDALRPGGVYYVTGPQGGDLLLLLLLALKESGLILKHMLIWAKNNHVLGRCDYNYKHEPILYGWKEGGHKFYGDGTDKSVWEIDKPSASKLHPTMKPVELYERAIRNSSLKGETVLEPFSGSGTALIACHQTGRVCHAIEIDPHYVDVACRRFQQLTGIKPVLEATGEPHDFGAD